MTSRRERSAEAVLLALRTHGPQDVSGLVRLTGLTHTAVSKAIRYVRNNHPHYITVPDREPWLYAIAPTVASMLPGWLNQRKHDLTRAESEVTRVDHALRLAATAAEVSMLMAARAQAIAMVASVEAEIALLRTL
jgi:hypothetical protein